MQVYWCQAQFGIVLSEVEYLLDFCMSMQQHLYIILTIFSVALVTKRSKLMFSKYHLQFVVSTQIQRVNLNFF
jgi:hypothetical protein